LTLGNLQFGDSALDAELICGHPKRFGLDHEAERVDSEEAFTTALAQPRDIILADHQLPFFDEIQALSIAHEEVPHSPFIFTPGTLGEDRAIELLKKGVTNYVNLSRLAPQWNGLLLRREAAASGNRPSMNAKRTRASCAFWFWNSTTG
jgi:DNA-binding NtrC family response regulator